MPPAVHPHARGAYVDGLTRRLLGLAVHPHARGAYVLVKPSCIIITRFIPTHVGLTCALNVVSVLFAVHPHARGAYVKDGNSLAVGYRFIPTHVGLTRYPSEM